MDVSVIISLIAAFVCISIATYTDLKRREIPNLLPPLMVILGFCINAVIGGFASGIISLLSALVAFGIGLVLWRVRAWAGGDGKFFAGLAAILPSGFLGFSLFPLMLLIISMATFVVFTLLYNAYFAARGMSPTMKRVKIDKLEVGNVPGEFIFKDGLTIKRSPYGRGHPCPKFTEIYADPRGMEGLTREQIAKLKEALGEDDTLYIRRTHPFAPFFTIGLVVMLVLII